MPRMSLKNVPFVALQKEISRRQKLLPTLIAQRDELDRQIAAIQGLEAAEAAEPAATKAPKKARRRRRAKNKISLADALVAFLAGKLKVGVAEAMQGVLEAGYKTKSKIFRTMVNQTLLKDKRFKKVGRGEFALKG